MPVAPSTLFAALAVGLLAGGLLGWILRGSRASKEKAAISAGWQAQLGAQRSEQDRLANQSKGLMEQISQYQASGKDATLRARELASLLKEALARRDELQRQIKEIRSSLDTTVSECEQLRSDAQSQNESSQRSALSNTRALQEKDTKIFVLSRELDDWKTRLPPLLERFRQRDESARELELELAAARARIHSLEALSGSDETRVEPVSPGELDQLNASNDAREDRDDARSGTVHAINVNGKGWPHEVTNTGDNLQRIKGVGPAIEKMLHELGIRHFHQIAEMSEYDIDRVAERLKGFRSRIYREDWIGQAQELRDSKSRGF